MSNGFQGGLLVIPLTPRQDKLRRSAIRFVGKTRRRYNSAAQQSTIGRERDIERKGTTHMYPSLYEVCSSVRAV